MAGRVVDASAGRRAVAGLTIESTSSRGNRRPVRFRSGSATSADSVRGRCEIDPHSGTAVSSSASTHAAVRATARRSSRRLFYPGVALGDGRVPGVTLKTGERVTLRDFRALPRNVVFSDGFGDRRRCRRRAGRQRALVYPAQGGGLHPQRARHHGWERPVHARGGRRRQLSTVCRSVRVTTRRAVRGRSVRADRLAAAADALAGQAVGLCTPVIDEVRAAVQPSRTGHGS